MRIANLRFSLDSLIVLKGVMSLLKDPTKTESVYDIEDGMKQSEAMAVATKYMLANPEIAALTRERYVAPLPNIDRLLQCPEGSLGRAYATYISDAGFDPAFYRSLTVDDDTSYLLLRLRQTHDLWHVLTGFATDVPGELGLKAFELAQTRRTMAGILIAGGFVKCLLQTPTQLDLLLDRLAAGYRMGNSAQPLLAQKWEEDWDKPVAKWRQELGIVTTA